MTGAPRYRDLPNALKWRGSFLVLFDWAVIFVLSTVAVTMSCWWCYALVIPFIGGRMMGLFALLHDGHHNMLAPVPALNDLITRYLVAWPIFRDDLNYGAQHDAHHRHLGSEGDPNHALLRYPEFTLPMKRWRLVIILLFDLFCINYLRYFIIRNVVRPVMALMSGSARLRIYDRLLISKIMFWAVIGSALFYFGMVKEFFFLWLIPFMGWHQMAIRVTLLADHCFANGDSRLLVRSVTPHFLGRIFIAPHNLGLHAEHHFFGDVACSDLPLVTSRLEATQRLADRFARSEDYWTVLRELTTSVR